MEKSVGRSCERRQVDALLLFFFAGIGTVDELALLFGFATEALLLALLFVGGGGGGEGSWSSSPPASSSSEFPPTPSSSSSDLSDRLASVDEAVDTEGFRAILVP